MISEDEFKTDPNDVEDVNEQNTGEEGEQKENEKSEDTYGFITAKEILAIEGIGIAKLAKLDTKDMVDEFMGAWYPQAVDVSEKMNLDKALSKIIQINNPYIAVAIGLGLVGLTGMMTAQGIKKRNTKPKNEDEAPKVVGDK